MAKVTASATVAEIAQPSSSEYPTQQASQLSASMPKFKQAWIAACGNPAAYEFAIVRCPVDPLSRALSQKEVAQYRLPEVAGAPRPTAALRASFLIMTEAKAAKAAKVRLVPKAEWAVGANKGNRWAVFCWSENGKPMFQYVVPISRSEKAVLSNYSGTALSWAAERDSKPVGLSAEEKAASAPRANAPSKAKSEVKAPGKAAQSAKGSGAGNPAPAGKSATEASVEPKASAQDKIRAKMAQAAEARQKAREVNSGNGATIVPAVGQSAIEIGTMLESAASAQDSINSGS